MKLLIFCMLLCSLSQCQELLLSGTFIATVVNGSEALQSGGIIAYDPITDTFDAKFAGGVYQSIPGENNASLLTLLKSTPMGMYGTGNFYYVGENFEYSSAILQYEGTTNQFQGLNGGISSTEITSIAFIGNYVVFGGYIQSVQSLSLEAYLQGKNDIEIPNIIKMDENNNFSLLEDPNNIFNPEGEILSMVNTPDGSILFLYASQDRSLYSWDETNYWKLVTENANCTGPLVVDNQNNLYFRTNNAEEMNGDYYCQYAFYNATNQYTVEYEYFPCNCIGSYVLSWDVGVLVVSFNSNCTETNFFLFDPNTGLLEPTNIAPFKYTFNILVRGANNDLWGEAEYNRLLYYYSSAENQWILVDLNPVTSYLIWAMEWDSQNNYLLLFVADYTANTYNYRLLKVTVPTSSEILLTNALGSFGYVMAATAIEQEHSTNYDYYIGGTFDAAGNGVSVLNFAKYSNGIWSQVSFGEFTENGVLALTSFGPNLFYSFGMPASGRPLAVGGFNTQLGNEIVFNIPVASASNSALTYTICAVNQTLVFFGGNFIVPLANGNTARYVIGYDIGTQSWFDLGIPFALDNVVYSLSTSVLNDVNYLLITGQFQFAVGGVSYVSYALYNLVESVFVPNPVALSPSSFSGPAKVVDAILDGNGMVYMTGNVFSAHTSSYPVAYANSSIPNSLASVGNLSTYSYMKNIALFTNSSSAKSIFAAGSYDYEPSLYGIVQYPLNANGQPTPNRQWQSAGNNVLYESFSSGVMQLVYTDGGKGQNGVN